MAQTVAMVRGTASATANPSNTTTIFTNTASGLGTRVITNMLTVRYTGSYTQINDASQGRISIIHTSSSGSSQVIGRYGFYTQGFGGGQYTLTYPQAYGMQFNIYPNILNQPNSVMMQAGSGASTYYTSTAQTGFIFTGQNASTVPATISNDNSLGQYDMAWVGSSNITKTINYMPMNFWIGPSDTIQIRCGYYGYYQSGKSQYYGYQTASVGYSFTTITES